MVFPKGFLWDSSLSSAQVEGGYDRDERGSSIWDIEQLGKGACSFHYASGPYHHWEEDITLMTKMGSKAHGMSVSWSRILPDDGDEINQERIDFYEVVSAGCHKYDIEPAVTIFHFDLLFVSEKRCGNQNNHRMMDTYVTYYRVLSSESREDVTHWLTHNEQNILIFFGAMDMTGGSDRVQNLDALYSQAHIQLVARAETIHPCHELCPGARIGPAPNIITSYPKSCNPIDYITVVDMDDLRSNSYLDVLVFGKYPEDIDHCFELSDIQTRTEEGGFGYMRACHPGFIDFNCYGDDTAEYLPYFEIDCEAMLYVGNREVGHLMKLMDRPSIGRTMQNKYPVSSEADGHSFDSYRIHITARKLTQRYHSPVLTMENDYGREDVLEADGLIHDSYRAEHLRETVRQMRIGIEEGVDIMGYCPWPAIDLVPAREGISKRYGFAYADRNEDNDAAKAAEMKRYRKDNFYQYQQVIASNDVKLEE